MGNDTGRVEIETTEILIMEMETATDPHAITATRLNMKRTNAGRNYTKAKHATTAARKGTLMKSPEKEKRPER